MKNKKVLIPTIILSASMLLAAVPVSISLSKAINSGAVRTLTSEITPTKPGRGETVTFLPESLAKFWAMDDLVNTYASKATDIGELTQYTDELTSWTSYPVTEEGNREVRKIFDKYDIYRPTNNILSWDSSISAKSYRVIISQDKTFSTIEREYVVNGTENSVIFDNPYTGTNYYWQVIATKNDDTEVYSDVFNFTVSNLPRTIKLDGVSNTRDLGGNASSSGKKTKEGLVYRGSRLEAITNEAKEEFKNELGIKTEVDLRGIGEGTENVLGLSDYYHYPSPYDYTSNTGMSEGIETTGPNSLVTNFGNAVKVFANKDNYPIYFHCSVGRDRTGWMGLVLNFLCGVSEEVALKEFTLSLFSTSGAYVKGSTDFYTRYIRIRDYLNTFNGNNLSEKTEDYLVTKAGVTHEQCESIRKILLGDVDTGFVPGKVNTDSYESLAKVTFRTYGQTPIIKMVEIGSLLDDPGITGNGNWYHGDTLWNFEEDTVQGDMYLDYIAKDKCKVAVHYTGIDLPDDAFDVEYNTVFDFDTFKKDGYTYKVYDDTYNQLDSLTVTDDVSINVIYSPIGGYVPKSNSRIIILAGQSNAAGVGHYQYLETSLDEAKIKEINEGYDNVLMTGYSHGDYYNDFRKVYADSHYSSAGTVGTFGFEVPLADRLSKAFPDETTYIVKYAFGGCSLNYDFISPSSDVDVYFPPVDGSHERGWLYNGLVESLTNTIAKISETTNTIPMVDAFMWMQGESDATIEGATNAYLYTFNNMINDFKETFKDNISYDFTVYDALICETSVWQLAKQMNGIKKSRVDEHNVIIDTVSRLTTSFEPIGKSTDQAHYDAACYIDLGHMFADAYLEKEIRGYTHNAIEIEAPEKITLKMGQDYTIETPVVLFNGEPVEAKMSYFAKQHIIMDDVVISYFTVNNNETLTPTRVGESLFRITAYYHDEIRTVLVPVTVVA